jgi:hypothetical protein
MQQNVADIRTRLLSLDPATLEVVYGKALEVFQFCNQLGFPIDHRTRTSHLNVVAWTVYGTCVLKDHFNTPKISEMVNNLFDIFDPR